MIMNYSFPKYFLFFLLLGTISCVTKVNVPVRQTNPYLVVEGSISTDPGPYTVKLSYSGKFSNTVQASRDTTQIFYITDAKVSIKDDLGDSTSLVWVNNGTYQSTDSNFIGIVGRSYTLSIYLSNGKTYVSTPEMISAVPPIDSVTVAYDSSYISGVRPTQLIISTNVHDPAGIRNFYRWTSYGYIPRKSWGAPCFFGNPPCNDPFSCTCSAFCVQLLLNNQITVLSDKYIDGQQILNQPVFYSPVYWKGTHYIEIKQASITQEDYIFWEQYLAQTNRTGSILDPLPSSLIGNIHNTKDSTDLVLGYFEASDVVTKRVKITPFFLQTYLLESIAGDYVQQGDCHSTYPNSLEDGAAPVGWENAQLIEMH